MPVQLLIVWGLKAFARWEEEERAVATEINRRITAVRDPAARAKLLKELDRRRPEILAELKEAAAREKRDLIPVEYTLMNKIVGYGTTIAICVLLFWAIFIDQGGAR